MRTWFRRHILQFGLACIAFGIFTFLIVITLPTAPVSAAPLPQGEKPSDETCLECHQEEGMSTEINGQPLFLTIDAGSFSSSVHGTEGIACVDCHTNITGFPHPEVTADSPRDFSLEMYPTCQQCHGDEYQKTLNSVHQTALAAGNTNAAVCTDCHNPHTQTRITDSSTGKLLPEARAESPETCARCHNSIYEMYSGSVHGAALIQENNPDVPTCIDCHGVHDIQNPTSSAFHNNIPSLCASCHTNEELMAPYGIKTNVLDTYVSDFHGTTVKLFEETNPDQPTDKPVCTDCHGAHDIIRADDPVAGIRFKDNLLVKCQQCHPNATSETFTDSWLSHYEPSPYAWPLVYYVNLFYKFFIPAVLGGMGVFVLSDVYRRFIARKPHVEVEKEEEESTDE